MEKNMFKMSSNELVAYTQAMRRNAAFKKKKGRGSYSRKQKHKNRDYSNAVPDFL